MRRREFIAFLGGVVLAPCFAAEAQQETRVWRIGYLASSTKEENIALLAGFHAGLKELDYVEEQNLKIEYRFAEMDLSRLKSLAADLVAQNVDVIVATTPHAAQAAMSITRTTPIIVLTASDPVAWGLAQSLARPGWNATGISTTWEDGFTAKWVELLKEVSPSTRHIALLRYPGRPRFVEVMEQAAASFDVRLTAFNVESTPALEAALAEIAAGAFDAMIVESSPLMWGHRARIIQLAAERRLPAMYSFGDYVRGGGLMSYGADQVEIWRRGAYYVDRVLKGVSPSELPFERWSKINLTINLKTAAALGLAIPETLLDRADEVIE